MTDEAVELMRRLWSEDRVTHEGAFYKTHELTIQPKPMQQPIPIWFGGRTQAAYRRVARSGDGFLGAYQTPADCGKAVGAIREAAETYERAVPEDHYGTIVPFHLGDEDISHEVEALVKRFPKMPFDAYAAWRTPDALLRRIDDYVEAGITKFVMRPMATGAALYKQFARLAKVAVPHYHG
jgi:alkanesulfonate monooxygenase SsuD/methylene tetrahydromethanopterin reductase-like flavin-dependent oxidoreductase (luciferase family)